VRYSRKWKVISQQNVKLCCHPCRRSGSFAGHKTGFQAKCSKLLLTWILHTMSFRRGFSVAWPWNRIAFCATRAVKVVTLHKLAKWTSLVFSVGECRKARSHFSFFLAWGSLRGIKFLND
jgi:hypothetical protein